MSKRVQLRRGTTAETSTFTGANGEVTVDTTKKTLVVHDGVTSGGHPLMNETSFGVGNSRLDVTSSRALGTTYTNTSDALKMVSVQVKLVTPSASVALFEGSSGIYSIESLGGSNQILTMTGIILPGRTYRVQGSNSVVVVQKWVESI